jgi:hypothetical protein
MRGTRGKRPFAGLAALVALVATSMVVFAGGASAIVAGAGYTTTNSAVDGPGTCFNGPGLVNCNIYNSKTAVWINGGPTNGTSALSDGTYFFVVGVPGGENSSINDESPYADGSSTLLNLSDDFDQYTNREFTVVNHHIATSTSHEFANGKIRLAPYSDTTNPGGEYFVALCRIDQVGYPADPSQCKYDNFKIKTSDGCTENCTPTPFGTVSGEKYYDANANGQLDLGEVGIPNWPIDFTDGVTPNTQLTDTNGQFSLNLSPAGYTFAEELPNTPTTWMQTGNTVDQTNSTGGDSATLNANKSYSVTVVDGGTTTGLYFGNICLGARGGLTLGFWSNKNGAAILGANSNAVLNAVLALNLRNGNGTLLGSVSLSNFQKWLLQANATNMANMLSAQLAAMKANVVSNKVAGSSLVYAADLLAYSGSFSKAGLSSTGFITITDLMTLANNVLLTNGLTVGSSDARTYEEALKNALDRANNNLNFVEPDAAHCPTPVFPGA